MTPAPQTLRWLYVDFNSYFASVEQQLRPELRGKPIVVVPVDTDATSAIAASYEAKAYGIRTGTPIYEAKRMCPGLVCVLANHEYYVDFHHRIKAEVQKHIPVTQVCSIDEVACRLMNNETSIKRATEIALSIKRGLAEHIGEYVKCSIGIAANKYLAKIATDLYKPDGLTFLSHEDIPAKLLKLKLRDLPGIGRNMELRLAKAGILTMQGLWELDAKRMRKVWGSVWGEKMYYMLRGVEVPDEETSRHSIGHSHVLAPELRTPDKAKFVARRLVLKAASRLRRMEYYASSLHVSIRLDSYERFEASLQCYRANDSITFLQMLEAIWQLLMREMKGERIRKVSITLSGLVGENLIQPELFSDLPDIDLRQRARQEKMSKALDKINHRFGRDSVLVGMLPSQGKTFSGSKIAFTRIPDVEEFLE